MSDQSREESVESKSHNSIDDEHSDHRFDIPAKFEPQTLDPAFQTKEPVPGLSDTNRSLELSNELIITKINKLIEETNSKDSMIKNNLFIIKKLKDQLANSQAELMSRENVVKALKEDIKSIEHKEKEYITMKSGMQQLKTEVTRLKEENRVLTDRLQQNRVKAEARIDRVNKLTSTLTSENSELKRASSVVNPKELDHLKKELKLVKEKLRKAEKEADKSDANNKKLKQVNHQLMEKLEELRRDFQYNEFQEIINPNPSYNKNTTETHAEVKKTSGLMKLDLDKRYLYEITTCYSYRKTVNRQRKRIYSLKNYFSFLSFKPSNKILYAVNTILYNKSAKKDNWFQVSRNKVLRLKFINDRLMTFCNNIETELNQLNEKIYRLNRGRLLRLMNQYWKSYKHMIYLDSMRLTDSIKYMMVDLKKQ